MFHKRGLVGALCILIGSCFVASSAAQSACETTTRATAVPSTGTGVELQSYSYCGGTLNVTVYIENLNYNKLVTLYYTNGANQSTPLTVVSLGYLSSIPDSNWEFWGASTPVYVDGITELLNLKYQATDIKKEFTQELGLEIVASGSPPPSPAEPPVPYASPVGLAQDITDWLAPSDGSEAVISKDRMFNNINVPGAANGTVIAAQSYTNPDYSYNWVRDSSLTMDVVYSLYAAATSPSAKAAYEQILFGYAQARATEQNDPNTITGLGEPKFYLNNTAFTGPWGRPQNDGPATSAITLMEFAYAYLKNNGSLTTVQQMIYDSQTYPDQAPVLHDLLFVASNWSSPSFDLWEEEESDHFYTGLVQRRALVMGSAFATMMGDSSTSAILSSAADALTATLSRFWDPNRKLILYEYGPVLRGKSSFLDIAVVLGVIHGYAGDGVFSYTNDEVLVSAYKIATSFLAVYPIANVTSDPNGLVLGIPIGRYPEDVYDGTGTTLGNPWYLCTAAMAELFYRSASEFQASGQITVTDVSLPFWNYFAPQGSYTSNSSFASGSPDFESMISSLEGWADAFMRRIKYHTPTDGRLAEEFNRATGVAQGAADLTWSYASVLTVAFARAELTKDTTYVTTLANLGLSPSN